MYYQQLKMLLKRALKSSTFGINGYAPLFNVAKPSDHALEVAALIRGVNRKPAIIIHGVMPRSGTVYIGELLRLHPDLYAYPNDIWETPFLELTGDMLHAQKHFFRAYKQNISKVGENDFLPLFGSSFIAYLHSFVPEGKRMLLKIPDVQYLNYFLSVFPHENLLLLMRDGRDVVNSTIKTWPQKNFPDVCKLWDYSARMILSFCDHYSDKREGKWVAKYEEGVRDPVAFVKDACKHFGLDQNKYPFKKIKEIPVRGSSSLKQNGRPTWDSKEKPKNFNPVGRWNEWPPKKKQTLKKIAGRTLMDAGYCENMDW